MNINRIALQLYTLRDHCQSAADLAATLKKLRAIGYSAVETGGFIPLSPAEVRSIAEGEGLAICTTYGDVFTNVEKCLEDMDILGAPYCMTGYPSLVAKPEDVERLVTGLEAAGAALKKAGKTLCYHNHSQEFYLHNGTPVLETLYARTNPEHLQAELDTYWVQYGGASPVQWCERLKGRLPLLHMKDYAVEPNGTPRFAQVGSGTLDFKAIVAAATAAGCQWFVVEQDEHYGNDPLDSVRKSFEYIKASLVG